MIPLPTVGGAAKVTATELLAFAPGRDLNASEGHRSGPPYAVRL